MRTAVWGGASLLRKSPETSRGGTEPDGLWKATMPAAATLVATPKYPRFLGLPAVAATPDHARGSYRPPCGCAAAEKKFYVTTASQCHWLPILGGWEHREKSGNPFSEMDFLQIKSMLEYL